MNIFIRQMAERQTEKTIYTEVRYTKTSMFCLSVPTHCWALSHWIC